MTGSICDVLPAAATAFGVPGAVDALGLQPTLAGVRRIGVVLVDGMGYHLLPQMARHAPLLASVLAGQEGELSELACEFPSTTPTSLVSLGTGARPGAHGVLGFTVLVPGTPRVLTHIAWRDDPDPRSWQPLPTWFERAGCAGVPSAAVLPTLFAGSGLTDAAYRGARFVGVERGTDYASALLETLRATRGVVYGYTPALDTAAHVHGIASPEWAKAAVKVDTLLATLVAGLPPDAALLVTADHGGLDVPPDRRVDLDSDRRLRDGVAFVAGEPRARYLHVVPGAAEDVVATWRGLLGERAEVLTRDEAIASGRYGPVPPQHAARIGDVAVTCRDDTAVLATRHEPPEVAKLIGFHGAATAVETAIPLIVFRG